MRTPLALAAAGLFLLAGCGSAPASPSPSPEPQNRYVVGGDNNRRDLYYLILSECSGRPSSWDSFRALCNNEELSVVVVSMDEYARYDQGDPYPKIGQ